MGHVRVLAAVAFLRTGIGGPPVETLLNCDLRFFFAVDARIMRHTNPCTVQKGAVRPFQCELRLLGGVHGDERETFIDTTARSCDNAKQ